MILDYLWLEMNAYRLWGFYIQTFYNDFDKKRNSENQQTNLFKE